MNQHQTWRDTTWWLGARPRMAALLQCWCVIFFCSMHSVQAGITDIANVPLSTSSTAAVLPNLLFILDNSGSMGSDYLPDWASAFHCSDGAENFTSLCSSAHPPYRASQFNAMYYNPAIRYIPPLNADGTSKPSQTTWTNVKDDSYGVQTSATTNLLTAYPDTEWCAGIDSFDCLRNGNYILPGVVNGKSYKQLRTTTANGTAKIVTGTPNDPRIEIRTVGPHYYTILPGEYCDKVDLRNCQSTRTAVFSFPSSVRWCTSPTNAKAETPEVGACQALHTGTHYFPRYPTVYSSNAVRAVLATPAVSASVNFNIILSGTCNNTNQVGIARIEVNGVNILADESGTALPTPLYTVAEGVAKALRDNIRGAGYSAGGSGKNVTISAPLTVQDNAPYYLSYRTSSNSTKPLCRLTLSQPNPKFSGYIPGQEAKDAVPGSYFGAFVRTDIVETVKSYPYPGSASKAPTRSDCAGMTCSYTEEMTNFANWFTYYRTRMQMMKSSTSIAFGSIGDRYRVGYFTINSMDYPENNLNVGTFNAEHKRNWYAKLFAAFPGGGTPLREALSYAGRIYAGKLTNKPAGADPMQYSCQQNFTILSTDGNWTRDGGEETDKQTIVKVDGSAIGDEDNALTRPRLDETNTPRTLADVAAHYYNNDLRSTGLSNCKGAPVAPSVEGNDVCENNVPISGLDAAAHQHMTTFTVGLGISGYMQYAPNYLTASTGDYFNVKHGVTVNAAGGVCSWQEQGSCNWPVPSDGTQANVDDLWHAAVNGYGSYFSANNPADLSSALKDALAGVSARTGTTAAATTSNPNIVTGDNFLFSSTYTSGAWYGELERQQIDLGTGAVSVVADWSAQAKLDVNNARLIYTYDPNAAQNKLKPFIWENLTTSEQEFFNAPAINSLSQFCNVGVNCLSAEAKKVAAGKNLLDYLSGSRSFEGSATDVSKYYRQRTHILGDIVNAEAAYVKLPMADYLDAGYAAFKKSYSERQGMVYVAANDGMLHAFDAESGSERWAYVPSLVLPRLYKLAEKNYANLHSYQLDGTPVQSDVFDGTTWRSILVGGMNAAGRGYYALDVTNPESPKALWEFTSDISKGAGYTKDANLGYSFGKPEISKLADGTWVVFVTSGLNNVPDAVYNTGNGQGYLYVLNAVTGALIRTIGTGIGSVETPSGLAQIRGWVQHGMEDNTALRVYGGDGLGNLWRFDINNTLGAPGYEAFLLATLRDASGNLQPMTAKPELGDVDGNAMVYVGTGRYLGVTDGADTRVQSIYAIKDPLGTVGQGNPRGKPSFIQQTLAAGICPDKSPPNICTSGQNVRTGSNLEVNLTTDDGWYVDLPDRGERAYTDPQLALGTLAFTTNVPSLSACTVGGYSYFYFFDYRTGKPLAVSPTGVVGKMLGSSLATRPVFVRLPNNTVLAIVRLSDGTTVVPDVPIAPLFSDGRRLSWRELSIDY